MTKKTKRSSRKRMSSRARIIHPTREELQKAFAKHIKYRENKSSG